MDRVRVITYPLIFLALSFFTCQSQNDFCGANLVTKIACHRLCDVETEAAFRTECVDKCCTGSGGDSSPNATAAACNCSESGNGASGATTAQPNDANTGPAPICPTDWESLSDLNSSSLAGGPCPTEVALQAAERGKALKSACDVRCRCDPKTGEWQWHWAADHCHKLGDLIQTKHPKALKHNHCGGLAVRSWEGKVCPMGCIAQWIQFVDSETYTCGKKVKLMNG